MRAENSRKAGADACRLSLCRYLPHPMTTTRSSFCIAFVLGIASTVSVAIAAAPGKKTGTKTESHAVAPPMKAGPDGWYDASPPGASFVVRFPGVFQGFVEDGTTEAGAVTSTVGVRATLTAAFGSQTSYVASCIQQKNDKRTQKERLQSIIDRWDTIGAMRYRKPLESASMPGLEFEMADDVKVLRGRLYAPANGTCTLLVSWRPAAKPSDADLEKFFDSFKLAKR